MAVANTFIFGTANSSTYGVVIEGPGDYSAPSRAVEEISIPGRNGAFVLDKGYYENIEIEYKVLIENTSQSAFETSVSSFRNAIVSQIGYQRLTDTYHPDEYRMAMYSGGFDEAPEWHGKGAIFKIKFLCKPQRFLTSGETAVALSSGDTITNPTLFESSPLLEVDGYGDIVVGDGLITIQNIELGEIPLTSGRSIEYGVDLDVANLNVGDSIYTLSRPQLIWTAKKKTDSVIITSIDSVSNGSAYLQSSPNISSILIEPTFTGFTYGTSDTIEMNIVMTMQYQGVDRTCTLTVNYKYGGSNHIYFQTQRDVHFPLPSKVEYDQEYNHPVYYGYSTVSTIPSPLYIDLDIGEAYGELNGTVLSLNNIVSIPANLPTYGNNF